MNKYFLLACFLFFLLAWFILLPLCSAYYPYKYQALTIKYTLDYNLDFKSLPGKGGWIEVLFLSPREFDRAKEDIIYKGTKLNPYIEFDEYGNRWVKYRFEDIKEKSIQILREYIITNSQKRPTKGDHNYPDSNYIIINEDINAIANSLYSKDNLEFFISVTDWINKNLEYEYSKLNNLYYYISPSTETLKSKKGVCADFSILEAAILRSKGINTRFVVGLVFDGSKWASHAWLEAYDSQLGWVGLDPAYNQVYNLDLTHIKIGYFSDYSEMHDSIQANFDLGSVSLSKGSSLDLNIEIISEKPLISKYNISYPKDLKSNMDFNLCIDSEDLVVPVQLFSSLEPKEVTSNLYTNKCITIHIGDYNGFVYAPYVLYLPGKKIEASFEINKPQVPVAVGVAGDMTSDVTANAVGVASNIDTNQDTNKNIEPITGLERDYFVFIYLSVAALFIIFLLMVAKRYLFKPSL